VPKIPKAYSRARKKLRESATPLYRFIVGKLHGLGMGPLGTFHGALTEDWVKAIQRPGRRGHVDVTYYEPPGGATRQNKYLNIGAQPFDGAYPRDMLDEEGLEILYDEKKGKGRRRK